MQSFHPHTIIKCYCLVLKLSMNSGHMLESPSNLIALVSGKLRDSMSFFKIILILCSVWLSVTTTVSLPSIISSMNAFMTTILGVLHLFSEARDKHGNWIIVSMSGFEILFQPWVIDDCLFWFVMGITALKFGLV